VGWDARKEEPVRIPNRRSEPEPDVSVVRGSVDDYATRHPDPEDVALVVEVTHSSLAKDRALARIDAGEGIPAYSIVNVPGRRRSIRDPLAAVHDHARRPVRGHGTEYQKRSRQAVGGAPALRPPRTGITPLLVKGGVGGVDGEGPGTPAYKGIAPRRRSNGCAVAPGSPPLPPFARGGEAAGRSPSLRPGVSIRQSAQHQNWRS
jgi:hypothetical protein